MAKAKTTSPEEEFADKVWQSVLIGATNSLFDPRYAALASKPEAVKVMMRKALAAADDAKEVALNYHKAKERFKEEKEEAKANDPLKEMLS